MGVQESNHRLNRKEMARYTTRYCLWSSSLRLIRLQQRHGSPYLISRKWGLTWSSTERSTHSQGRCRFLHTRSPCNQNNLTRTLTMLGVPESTPPTINKKIRSESLRRRVAVTIVAQPPYRQTNCRNNLPSQPKPQFHPPTLQQQTWS